MSMWMHVIGSIRFDVLELSMYPEPPNKIKLRIDIVNKVHDIIQRSDTPAGSEGPLEFETIDSERGPIIVLSGDLRDFGEAEDRQEICNWLQELVRTVSDEFVALRHGCYLRDACVRLETEFDENIYLLVDGDRNTIRLVCLNETKTENTA